ncbi:hypothetical protein [Desulfovibrio sp. Fe33]|uniref:hypothetical protein n=1 Tax=Desulfovibrio sp. Fe33 TaxID=3020842 RepID=UPI00234C8681|nr:hypothetical protein [Desulfovibrio sp. Fe33]
MTNQGDILDYSDRLFEVGFEVADYKENALRIIRSHCNFGFPEPEKSDRTYTVIIPMQIIPEVIRSLCEANIAVYGITRRFREDAS